MKLDNWFTTLGMIKVYSDIINIESNKDNKIDYTSINKIIKAKVEDTFRMLYLNKNLGKYKLLNIENFLEIPNINKSAIKHKQDILIHIKDKNISVYTNITVISVKENNIITYFFGIVEK